MTPGWAHCDFLIPTCLMKKAMILAKKVHPHHPSISNFSTRTYITCMMRFHHQNRSNRGNTDLFKTAGLFVFLTSGPNIMIFVLVIK